MKKLNLNILILLAFISLTLLNACKENTPNTEELNQGRPVLTSYKPLAPIKAAERSLEKPLLNNRPEKVSVEVWEDDSVNKAPSFKAGYIWVKNMNIRMEPSLDSPVKAKVHEGGEVFFTGKKSAKKTDVILRGKRYLDYWYEVQLTENEAISGWVHGSGLKLVSDHVVRVNQLLSDPLVLRKKLPASYIAGFTERQTENGKTISLIKLNRKYVKRIDKNAGEEDQFVNICIVREGSNILYTETYYTEKFEEFSFYSWNIKSNVAAIVHQNQSAHGLIIFDTDNGKSYETDSISNEESINSKSMDFHEMTFSYVDQMGLGDTYTGQLHMLGFF